MTMPLVVLAALSVGVAWFGWHEVLLAPPTDVVVAGRHTIGGVHDHEHSGFVMALAVVAGLGGLGLGLLVFGLLAASVERMKRPFRGLERAFAAKFWCDELYREVLLRPSYSLAQAFAWTDANVVDGVVNEVGDKGTKAARVSGTVDAKGVDGLVIGVGEVTLAGGETVSWLQNGRVRFYLALSVGITAFVLVLSRIL
jgi:NADH:ubiquinone oxidoreductase subunit 5 (subunit L)/multisubunit Na+/H+ antiporter MnhA subunit